MRCLLCKLSKQYCSILWYMLSLVLLKMCKNDGTWVWCNVSYISPCVVSAVAKKNVSGEFNFEAALSSCRHCWQRCHAQYGCHYMDLPQLCYATVDSVMPDTYNTRAGYNKQVDQSAVIYITGPMSYMHQYTWLLVLGHKSWSGPCFMPLESRGDLLGEVESMCQSTKINWYTVAPQSDSQLESFIGNDWIDNGWRQKSWLYRWLTNHVVGMLEFTESTATGRCILLMLKSCRYRHGKSNWILHMNFAEDYSSWTSGPGSVTVHASHLVHWHYFKNIFFSSSPYSIFFVVYCCIKNFRHIRGLILF